MPKKPQDHKKPKGDDLTVTVRGVECTINVEVLNSWELTEIVSFIQSEDDELITQAGMQVPALLVHLIGMSSYTKLRSAARNEAGRIDPEVMAGLFEEIVTAIDPNSRSSVLSSQSTEESSSQTSGATTGEVRDS